MAFLFANLEPHNAEQEKTIFNVIVLEATPTLKRLGTLMITGSALHSASRMPVSGPILSDHKN